MKKEMPSKIEAILLDVDNTMLTPQKVAPKGLFEILARLHERRIQVGICTGRGYQMLKNTVLLPMEKVGLTGIQIISGGAQLINTNGEMIEGYPIPNDFVEQVVQNFANEQARRVLLNAHEAIFVNQPFIDDARQRWSSNVLPLSSYQKEAIYLININDLSKDQAPSFFFDDSVETKFMLPSALKPSVDVTMVGINKGTTVKRWSQLSSIHLENVIGVGDSANDLEFLKEVGFSVAMGNASDELKAQADLVIGDVENGGLVKFLMELLED